MATPESSSSLAASETNVSSETLEAVGLIREFRGKWQWTFTPGRYWRFSSSKESAVEQGVIGYFGLPVVERITMTERNARSDAEYDARMEAALGKFSREELENRVAILSSQIAQFQRVGTREFNGNGGRRTGPAVASEAARELGTEKMRIEGYIRRKFIETSPATVATVCEASAPSSCMKWHKGVHRVGRAKFACAKCGQDCSLPLVLLIDAAPDFDIPVLPQG